MLCETNDKNNELNNLIEELEKYKDRFEQCSDKLTERIQDIHDLTEEKELLKTKINDKDSLISNMNEEIIEIKNHCIALEADNSLRLNELQRKKEEIKRAEETAQNEIKKKLMYGLNNQLYYLTLFHHDLLDNKGKLNEENVDIYLYTLNEIENVLKNVGIKRIGTIDERVEYDSSIHISEEGSIANGEPVIIKGYGWIIGDEVYIKAPVEKGE